MLPGFFGVVLITPSEVLSELHRSQESAYNIRDASRQDHLHRAKICSKIVKYPHIEDYAVRAVLCFYVVLDGSKFASILLIASTEGT